MSKVQSKELTAFYRAYKQWLDDGAPEKSPFCRSRGLCTNLPLLYQDFLVAEEMSIQFKKQGLSLLYPFGENNYDDYGLRKEQHLDPLRIKWVEDHLKPEFTGEAT